MTSFEKMSSSSCNSITGEKYNMKQFILAAQDYNKTKCEETASLLSRYLQLLGVTQDLYTFDPHNSVAVQFFVSLHELMTMLDTKSNLLWCGVTVLQHACKNPATHKALIHVYQFLPILSKLLGDYLTREKKIKLLTLMQEVTFGIKISWQVSHIPHLIQILTKWIECGDEIIVALSLGVLLNLCYKNLPVTHTLMQTVNTKHFIRTVISTKTPATEIQICKLLIILEHFNGDIPDDVILNFMNVTFRTIVEAFRMKDLIRMRHIVEFFLDVKSQRNQCSALINFNYQTEVLRILEEVESTMETDSEELKDQSANHECMNLLFEFLNSLVELRPSNLVQLHEKIVNQSLNWVQNEMVCSKALALLKTITFNFPQNMSSETLQNLSTHVPLFLQLLQNNCTQTVTFNEHCKKLCALLQMIRALVCSKEVAKSVVDYLNEESVKNMLLFMTKNEEVLKYAETDDGVELCLSVLALIAELSQHDDSWYADYQQIIKQKQIHILLAKVPYIESEEVKLLLFEICQINKFPKREVVKAMCDIQSTLDTKINPANNQISTNGVGYTVMTKAQSTQLEKTIEKFKEAVANNQLLNVTTSEIMELYGHKMDAMLHMEQAYQASLDSAYQLNTQLQHKLAQMSAELSKLHQLIYHTQQCNEQSQTQITLANESIKKLSARLTKEEIHNKELINNLKEKENELSEKITMINMLENKQQELIQAKKALTKKYESQCEKNKALVLGAEKLENCVNLLNKDIQQKNETIAKSTFRIEQMTKEIKELEELRKQHESTIVAKDKELQDALKDLAERQKILETITKLTTSRV